VTSHEDEREPPERYLDKDEAIRHLIHAAVRMTAMGEDPFAIHMLIQSTEKLLIDLAKKRSVALAFDWEDVIKPEYKQEFFKFHRETYNFLKHADKDTADLPVHNIAERNAVALAMAIENYLTMFGTITEHMRIYRFFMRFWKPKWFLSSMDASIPSEKREFFNDAMTVLRGATPVEFFKALIENPTSNETFRRERNADVSDGIQFYSTPLENLNR